MKDIVDWEERVMNAGEKAILQAVCDLYEKKQKPLKELITDIMAEIEARDNKKLKEEKNEH